MASFSKITILSFCNLWRAQGRDVDSAETRMAGRSDLTVFRYSVTDQQSISSARYFSQGQ
jgi:hypothetical protein